MGWFSGKKTVHRLNPAHISKTDQEHFLRNYAGFDGRKLKQLKQQAQGDGLLTLGKSLPKSKFLQILKKYDPKAAAKFKLYERDLNKQYQQWQEELKREKIKKAIKLNRKRERAEEALQHLTGQVSAADLRKKRMAGAGKEDSVYELARENKRLKEQGFSDKEIMTMRIRERLQNSLSGKNNKDDIDQIKDQAKNLPELQI